MGQFKSENTWTKMKISLALLGLATALPYVQNEEASNFLARSRRASNKGHFEEMKKGNLERECIEETCDDQELYEVYDDENHPDIAKYNECKELVQKAQDFCLDNQISLDINKPKKWLRTCVTLTEEELKQQIKDKIGNQWNQFLGGLQDKLNGYFDQFSK